MHVRFFLWLPPLGRHQQLLRNLRRAVNLNVLMMYGRTKGLPNVSQIRVHNRPRHTRPWPLAQHILRLVRRTPHLHLAALAVLVVRTAPRILIARRYQCENFQVGLGCRQRVLRPRRPVLALIQLNDRVAGMGWIGAARAIANQWRIIDHNPLVLSLAEAKFLGCLRRIGK